MSSPSDVARFVEEAPCLLTVSTPQVGASEEPTTVVFASARDNFLAWNRASNVAANLLRVKSVSAGADTIDVIEAAWPNRRFTFRRPKTAAEREQVESESDFMEESEADYRDLIASALEGAADPPAPKMQNYTWARWSEFQEGEMVPAGVVLFDNEHNKFVFHPFAYTNELAALMNRRFRGWTGGSEDDAWAAMREGLTRNSAVADSERILAPSFADAVTRALYKFAEDRYREDGKVLIG